VDAERRAHAYRSVERLTEPLMLALALIFIPLLVVPLVVPLSAEAERVVLTLDWVIWAAFALELTVKTYLAPSHLRYLRDHWFDVLIVLLPFFRPLRLVRSVRLLRLLRLLRLISLAMRVLTSARRLLRSHNLHYTLLVGTFLLIASAGAVTVFERDGPGSITSFETALWWAATTITTVGYGDTFPVTAAGRGVAVFVMAVGIALFSVLTAAISAFFVAEDTAHAEQPGLDEIMAQLRRLEEQIAQLHAASLPPGAAPSPPADGREPAGADAL
jgi:voltage-gated potassium channel